MAKGRLFSRKLFGYNNKNQGGIMNLFILECKRILNDKIFIAVLFLNILFYLYINYSMYDIHCLSDNNFYMRLFFLSPDTTELTNAFYFILPILSCLVGSDVMAQDMRSKEFINILSRVNKKKYFLCKAVLSFVSAGIVMIIPFLLDFIVKLATYPANLPSVTWGASFYDVMGMSDIFVYNPMLYTILAILFTFLFSGLLGLVGFSISLFTNKKLIITSVPFIITIVIWNLVNILGIKDYSIASMLIFRITHNIHTFNELATAFIIPFLIIVFISFMGGKKYDYV